MRHHDSYRASSTAVVNIIYGGLLAATFGLVLAWVGVNFISGCGAYDPITRKADLDACILFPEFIASHP